MILDHELQGDLLCSIIDALLEDRGKLASMAEASMKLGKTQALDAIVDCIEELIK